LSKIASPRKTPLGTQREEQGKKQNDEEGYRAGGKARVSEGRGSTRLRRTEDRNQSMEGAVNPGLNKARGVKEDVVDRQGGGKEDQIGQETIGNRRGNHIVHAQWVSQRKNNKIQLEGGEKHLNLVNDAKIVILVALALFKKWHIKQKGGEG